MASHDSSTASPRPKRRLSVVSPPTSESSTVTLTNSPNDPVCHDLPTHDPGHKRRKSVTFSPVAQIIRPEYVNKGKSDVQNVDSPRHAYIRPLSYSNLNPNASLAISSHGWPIPNKPIEQASIRSMALPNGHSPRRRDDVVVSSSMGRPELGANDVYAAHPKEETTVPFVSDPSRFPSPDKRKISPPVQLQPVSTPAKRVSFTLQSPDTSHSQSGTTFPSFSLDHPDSQSLNASGPKPEPHPHTQQCQPPQLPARMPQPHPEESHPQPEHPVILLPSTKPPPRDVCAGINADIRRSATLNCPTFEFTEHVRRRRYFVRRRWLNAGPTGLQECVTMLDASVDALFPSSLPAPPSIDPNLFTIRPAFASLPSHSLLPHPSPLPPHPISTNSYSITKGLGMFALLPIASNQLIIAERPVVITPYIIALSNPVEEVYDRVFTMLGGELDDMRVRVEGLARFGEAPGRGSDGEARKKGYEAIMQVNALAIELVVPEGNTHPELKTHKGMFLNTSRINHSCSPNAKWEWDLKSYSLVVTAVRTIVAGEEITIAYVPPHLPYHVRRENLFAMYGFICVCQTCVRLAGQSPSDAEDKYKERVQESDSARAMLTGFWDGSAEEWGRGCVANEPRPSFKRWCNDPSLPADALISVHVQAMGLIQREGLEILDTHPGPGADSSSSGFFSSLPRSSSHKSDPKALSDTNANVIVHPLRDLGRHIDAIAMCYGALEDAENFKLWIGKAAEARGFGLREKEKELNEGPEMGGDEAKEERLAFMKWMANPLSFPVWGWRNKGIRNPPSVPQSIAVEHWNLDSEKHSPAGLRDCIKLSSPE